MVIKTMKQPIHQFGISGSTLKMIAIITMLLDHAAASVLGRILVLGSGAYGMEAAASVAWLGDYDTIYMIYNILRNIGRIAFPIFCFLLVEGFLHTGNKQKYAIRMLVFAMVSELPFDLALTGRVFDFSHQNVFFTLLLGLLTMMVCDAAVKSRLSGIRRTLVFGGAIFVGMLSASILNTDYAEKGILCIMALYIFRNNRIWQITAGCLSFFWWELPAVAAFLPIGLYNGKRGWNIKYFFYVFYPAHLLLLYFLCRCLRIGEFVV